MLDAAWGGSGFLDALWQLTVVALATWALVVVVAAGARARWSALGDLVAGGSGAAVLCAVIEWLVGPLAGDTRVPVAFAVACGALASIRPHLVRPFRRLGRTLVLAAAVALVVLERTTPSGALLAVLVGVVAAGVTRVALGSLEGRPDEAAVALALTTCGLDTGPVAPLEEQRAGVATFATEERTSDGPRPLVIRVYGREARDTQLLVKVARSLWYRERRSVLPTRVQQAEHEAFVTMLAGTRGAAVPLVRAVGTTAAGDAFVAFGGIGHPLHVVGSGQVAEMWRQLDLVHAAGLALRDVAPARFAAVPPDGVGVVDLSSAGLVTDDDVLTDRAQLMVATALTVGADAALDVAHSHLGTAVFGEVVPYLQPAALGRELRRELQAASPSPDVDALRDRAAEVVGIESPRIAQLRRVTPGSLVQMALMTFAAYAVISLLGGVDVDELVDTLSAAEWSWVTVALVVGQVTVISETISTQGASVRRLALGPLAALQVAIAFVKLAIPSSAARLGMVLRYFQKQGVPGPMALSVSAIETFTGFLVQVVLLALVLGFGSVQLSLPGGSRSPTGELLSLLAALLAAALVAVVVAAAVPRLRRRVLDRFRPWIGDARAAMGVLRAPVRLVELVGGNLATQLLSATALVACVAAFGSELDLVAALVVYVAAALFGGFMPVPGGIGVMEAALTVGLVAVGVEESTALAAAITFRIVTFYVPPLWGWVAFRWLERNTYL